MPNYYDVKKAAETLGVSPAEVNRLREENRLRGFRDGANWKFKAEDVEQLAKELKAEGGSPELEPGEAGADDVLLSEVALGGSDAGSSGTVIGQDGKESPADSDIQLAADSDIKLASGSGAQGAKGKGPDAGELDLTLDGDLTLEDSKVPLAEEKKPAAVQKPGKTGDSAVDLSAKGEGAGDDDVVLGGSGSGSDITIGGDSGISLVDPADSGLSLEEPLELGAGASDESLELGEDDMLTLDEAADTESPTKLQSDDDFLLTPLEEGGDEEDSESGSQVIALDSEMGGDEAATMVAGPGAAGMAAMLDEDLGGVAVGPGVAGPMGGAVGPTLPFGAPQQAFAEGAPMAGAMAALPEAPYSPWVVTGLVFCSLFIMLAGWMMFDLIRNIYSWGGTYRSTSWLMDQILSILPY